MFDVSAGKTPTLPVFHYPATVAAARADYPRLAALYPNDGLDDTTAYNQRFEQLYTAYSAQRLSPLTRRRVQDVITAINDAEYLPQLRTQLQAYEAASSRETAAFGEVAGGDAGGQDPRPTTARRS